MEQSSDVEQGAPAILSITLQNPRFLDDEAIEGLNDEFRKVCLKAKLPRTRPSYLQRVKIPNEKLYKSRKPHTFPEFTTIP